MTESLIALIENAAFYITADLPGTCDPNRQIVYLDEVQKIIRQHEADSSKNDENKNLGESLVRESVETETPIQCKWHGTSWHGGCPGCEAADPSTPVNRTLIRYCPECGNIGEVDREQHYNCCPDGNAAAYIHRKIAEQAKRGFGSEIPVAGRYEGNGTRGRKLYVMPCCLCGKIPDRQQTQPHGWNFYYECRGGNETFHRLRSSLCVTPEKAIDSWNAMNAPKRE